MNQATNYMRVTGPHRCVRCEGFECETSEEMTAHLDSKHPGWKTETLTPETYAKYVNPGQPASEEIADAKVIHITNEELRDALKILLTEALPGCNDKVMSGHAWVDMLYEEAAQRQSQQRFEAATKTIHFQPPPGPPSMIIFSKCPKGHPVERISGHLFGCHGCGVGNTWGIWEVIGTNRGGVKGTPGLRHVVDPLTLQLAFMIQRTRQALNPKEKK